MELELPKFPSCLLMTIIKLVAVCRLWPSERDVSFIEFAKGIISLFFFSRKQNKLTENKIGEFMEMVSRFEAF